MYSTKQIAELLGISTRTIQNYIEAGVLKGTIIGKNRRFTESEVLKLQQEGVPKDYYKQMKGNKK